MDQEQLVELGEIDQKSGEISYVGHFTYKAVLLKILKKLYPEDDWSQGCVVYPLFDDGFSLQKDHISHFIRS